MVPIPTKEEQEALIPLFTTLIAALQSHPKFTPPTPHPALLHTWDFVQQSRYILQNLENIRHGRPVEHPAQIPSNPEAKDDEQRARMSYADVVTRSITIDKLMGDTNMMKMLGMDDGVEFGPEIREASKKVVEGVLGVKDDTPDPVADAQV